MSPPSHPRSDPTPASARRTSSPRLWVIHHTDPRFVGLSVALGPGDTVLGRHGTLLDGALRDAKLSRQHCRIRRAGLLISVEDLASRNGTTVDGRPVTASPLPPDALLGIGKMLLCVAHGPNLPTHRHPRLVGVSPQWGALLTTLQAAVTYTGAVLIQGERGTGKHRVCDELHRLWTTGGERVLIEPDSTPDALLDALREPGHDTVILNRVDQATTALQASLLQFLTTELPVARLVTTSESPLNTSVASGQFDTALWARLAQLTIDTAPLRERLMDVAVLAHHLAERHTGAPVPFTRALTRRLVRDPWPDNVHGLAEVIARLASESRRTPWELPDWLPPLPPRPAPTTPTQENPAHRSRPSKKTLERLVSQHAGDVGEVAKALQSHPSLVYRWLRQDGIEPRTFQQ